MKILKMHATFGRLHEQTLELDPTMNIIHGANESGKSTWSAFLRVMLYGISTREKSKIGFLADKEKYAPWSGEPMYGKIEFLWQDKHYTLTRRAGRGGILQKAEIVEVETGHILDIPEPVGETLLGVRREVFERSAFIAQAQLAISGDKTGELERRITALSTTGEEDVSQKQVLERLEKWRRKLQYYKKGEIPELIEQIEQTTAALEEAREDAARLTAYHTQLENLSEKETEYEQKIALVKAFTAQHELEYILNSERKLMQTEQRADELGKASPLNEDQCAQMQKKRDFMLACRQKCAEDSARLECEREKICEDNIDVSPTRQLISAALCAIIVFGALLFVQPIIASAAAVLIFALGYVVFTRGFCKKNGAKNRAELKERIEENQKQIQKVHLYEEALEESRTQYVQAQEILRTAVQMIDSSYTEADVDTLISASEEVGREHRKACEAAAQMRARYEEIMVGRDREQLAQIARTIPDDAIEPEESAEVLLKQIDMCRSEREQRTTAIAILKDRIAARGELGALENELAEQNELLSEKKRDLDAITLAIEAVSDIQTEMQRRFAPVLEKRAGELFSAFTGGHFNIVQIENAEFALQVAEQDAAPPRQVLELSQGTLDELYLAVRLALCETVLPTDAPIILDDALVNFDDARMERALSCLHELSGSRQILLFTCHQREISFANENQIHAKALN